MVSRTEEVSPSVENNFDLPEAPEDLMLQAIEETLRGAAPTSPFAEAEEPDEDESDDEELEEEDEPDEEPDAEEDSDDEEAAEEGKPEGRSVDDWVNVLRTDGIQRISEIPRKLHKDVLPAYVESEKRQVAQDLGMVAQAQLIKAVQIVSFVPEIDNFFADDPDGKLAWLEAGSQDAQMYQSAKRMIEAAKKQDDTTVRMRNEQAEQLLAMQRKQYDRLTPYPELQAEIQQRYQQGAYPANMPGLERLTDDVMELLAKRVEAGEAKAPVKKKAQARKVSAETRRSVPRPDVSRGRTPAASDRDRSNMSSDDLIAMGINQQLANVRR